MIPSIPAVLGNFLLPLMIGARDVAFPRLNLLSWYIFMLGGMFTLYAVIAGGVDTGWTFYTPYSTHLREQPRDRDGARHFHRRLLLHPHRAQFHRDHPHDARAGHDLVSVTALCLVASTPPA